MDPTLFFIFACDTSRRGHIYKVYKEHATMRVRGQSSGVCHVNEWNNIPSSVVKAENLDKFKHNLGIIWHDR